MGNYDAFCDARSSLQTPAIGSPYTFTFTSTDKLDLFELFPTSTDQCRIGGFGVRRTDVTDLCAVKSTTAITIDISGVDTKS